MYRSVFQVLTIRAHVPFQVSSLRLFFSSSSSSSVTSRLLLDKGLFQFFPLVPVSTLLIPISTSYFLYNVHLPQICLYYVLLLLLHLKIFDVHLSYILNLSSSPNHLVFSLKLIPSIHLSIALVISLLADAWAMVVSTQYLCCNRQNAGVENVTSQVYGNIPSYK